MAYNVELDVYRGPMDLLLYLASREEVDIVELSLSAVVDQYIEYLERLEKIDINSAAEFLEFASRLIQLKARAVAPQPEIEDEEEVEDPRAQLLSAIFEYKKFKELAIELERLRGMRSARFGPGNLAEFFEETTAEESLQESLLKEVSLFDLETALEHLLQRPIVPDSGTIEYTEIPTEERMQLIMQLLRERPRILFLALVSAFLIGETVDERRADVVGTFVALLELARERRILVKQDRNFGRIEVVFAQEEPAGDDREMAAGEGGAPEQAPAASAQPADESEPEASVKRRKHFKAAEIELPEYTEELDEEGRRLKKRMDEILKRVDQVEAAFDALRRDELVDEQAAPEEADETGGEAPAGQGGKTAPDAEAAAVPLPEQPPQPGPDRNDNRSRPIPAGE